MPARVHRTKNCRCENDHLFYSPPGAPLSPCSTCGTELVYRLRIKEDDDEAAAQQQQNEAKYDGTLRVFTLHDKTPPPPARIATGDAGVDRVLGGGLVKSAIVLLGGRPGSGKTTIAMKIAAFIANTVGRVLFVSGEMQEYEIQDMAHRLGALADDLYLCVSRSVDEISEAIAKVRPVLVVADSVNVIKSSEATPGDVAQIKATTTNLTELSKDKDRGFSLWLIGHVTKEDRLAGPEYLQHLVDVVLMYSKTKDGRRVLKTTGKNRYGKDGEFAVYDMTGSGLVEIESSTSMLSVERRLAPERGCCVFPCFDTSNPFLLEVACRVGQAPAEGELGGSSERRYTGFNAERMASLLAVLREDASVDLRRRDLFVEVSNITEEQIEDPAIDLALVTAIVSGADNLLLPAGMLACGSVSLSGKVRPVARLDTRLEMARDAGYSTILLPSSQIHVPHKGLRVIGIDTLAMLPLKLKELAAEPVKVPKPKAPKPKAPQQKAPKQKAPKAQKV